MANEYSKRWFPAFLDTIPAAWTEREVATVCAWLPSAEFPKLLDVCCGSGRHAALLAERGYQLTGIDRDEAAIASARSAVPAGRFLVLDQRELAELDETFDAAMILWQSFGYFDAATNDRVLADLSARLRPGGRLLLDVYHPGWVDRNQGRHVATRSPACAAITNRVAHGRLTSTIEYVDGGTDVMDFELFEPEVLVRRAEPFGLEPVFAGCGWDDSRPPSPDEQRYQTLFRRR